jgi:hypothetical protein
LTPVRNRQCPGAFGSELKVTVFQNHGNTLSVVDTPNANLGKNLGVSWNGGTTHVFPGAIDITLNVIAGKGNTVTYDVEGNLVPGHNVRDIWAKPSRLRRSRANDMIDLRRSICARCEFTSEQLTASNVPSRRRSDEIDTTWTPAG